MLLVFLSKPLIQTRTFALNDGASTCHKPDCYDKAWNGVGGGKVDKRLGIRSLIILGTCEKIAWSIKTFGDSTPVVVHVEVISHSNWNIHLGHVAIIFGTIEILIKKKKKKKR